MDRQSMVVAGEPLRVTRNGWRYFSEAHREAVVAKCLVLGASLVAVALVNGFNTNLVRKWVRQTRTAVTPAATLLSVTIAAGRTTALPELPGRGQGRVQSAAAGPGSIRLRVKAIELEVQGTVDRDQLLLMRQVLGCIADHPINRIEELLPWNVANAHEAELARAA